jgi:hypothetical protein
MLFRYQWQCGAGARDAKMQPVSVQDSLLLAFSPGLEFLAVGTRDSRVKAFDTGAAHALPDDQMADLLAYAINLHTEDYVEKPADSIIDSALSRFTSVCGHQPGCHVLLHVLFWGVQSPLINR